LLRIKKIKKKFDLFFLFIIFFYISIRREGEEKGWVGLDPTWSGDVDVSLSKTMGDRASPDRTSVKTMNFSTLVGGKSDIFFA